MEKWEPLGIHLKVLVSKSHSFTTDSLLLAHFSAPRRAEPCADLGTGTAVIPLLWCGRASPGPILALELQPEAARMATRTVEANGLSQRITVLQADAREFKRHLPHQALGLVACNPPYFSAGTGLPSANPARAQARQAESLTLLDLALAWQKLSAYSPLSAWSPSAYAWYSSPLRRSPISFSWNAAWGPSPGSRQSLSCAFAGRTAGIPERCRRFMETIQRTH